MTAFIWFTSGLTLGIIWGLTYLWLSLRRHNRKTDEKVARRLREADQIARDVAREWDAMMASSDLRDSYGRPM